MVGVFFVFVPAVPYGVLLLAAPGASVSPLPAAADELLHAGPALLDGPSPLSSRAVRERSKNWSWKPLEGDGWKILTADHAVLRGDAPLEALRTSGAYLEAYREMLMAGLGGNAEGVVFSVRIFADPRAFRAYAAILGASNAESLYDPRTQEIVICHEPEKGTSWLRRSLAHEFTHAYMDRVFHRTEPLWLCEGLAEYFSNFDVHEGRLRPGRVDRRALLLLALDEPRPLRQFLRLRREDMYGPSFASHYAQAWSLAHHLMSRGDGTVDLLLRGESLEDVDQLEAEWKAHLKKIGE
ncbi:MAG TPA: DUF1570 domain-containing protein [Planctomycetota bacterium]|nr:DUF1570 domain-containing protein [Planctomycetota bacterium]